MTTSMATRIILGTEYGDAILRCPMCGCENVHPASVCVEQGNVMTIASNGNAVSVPTDRHTRRRGSDIRLVFWCEGGCEFIYSLEFHKGYTSVRLESLTTDNAELSGVNELWRD